MTTLPNYTKILLAVACIFVGALAQTPTAQPPQGSSAQAPVRVGVLVGEGSEPFTTMTNGQLGGFEVELMKQLCAIANLTCEFSPLNLLEDRIQALVNNTADVTIGHLAFTPGRATLVNIIRPCYYLAGTALYRREITSPGTVFTRAPELQDPSSTTPWFSLAGQTICFLNGYYATPFIVDLYDVEIYTVYSVEEGISKTRSGVCNGFAFPNAITGSTLPGLEATPNLAVAYPTPYCVAVARGNRDLANQLTVGLVAVHADGENSTILQLEQHELVSKGVPPNRAVREAVNVITEYHAEPGISDIPTDYTVFNAG